MLLVPFILSKELPQSVYKYIADNYPQEVIDYYEWLEDDEEFLVLLESGSELYFNADGEFLNSYMQVALPEKARKYIEENYPEQSIAYYNFDDVEQEFEVELSDESTVYFDSAGNFLREN